MLDLAQELSLALERLHQLCFELIVRGLLQHLFDQNLFAVLDIERAESGPEAASGDGFFNDVSVTPFYTFARSEEPLLRILDGVERGLPQLPGDVNLCSVSSTLVAKERPGDEFGTACGAFLHKSLAGPYYRIKRRVFFASSLIVARSSETDLPCLMSTARRVSARVTLS